MKGIIFNLLELFIIEIGGEKKLDEIIAKCPLKTKEPFVAPGTYPDEDFFRIVDEAVKKFNIQRPDLLVRFGRFCIPKLAEKYPGFFEKHNHPKPFLKTMDMVHFQEVAKLYKDSTPPHFTYQDPAPEQLVMQYSSKRQLCHFVKGLIEGVGDYYRVSTKYEKLRCMLDGDQVCEFSITFSTEKK